MWRKPRQRRILDWACATFGVAALNQQERAARVIEEALELVQAEGLLLETVNAITARVYSNPVGNTQQEIAGLMLTLEALAENNGINASLAADAELTRVLDLPKVYFVQKHAEKVKLGIAAEIV